MKQIVRVIFALECGLTTSREVADETGMTLAAASSYLSALCTDGLVRVTGAARLNKRGQRSNVYELVRQKVGAG